MTRSITPVLAVLGAGLALAAGPAVAATSPTTPAAPAPTAAKAPAVGPQKTWTKKTAPVDIPSTGIRRGDKLPKGSVLVYRAVNVPKGEKRRVRLVVPEGKKLVTAAQSGAFGSAVIGQTSYVGKRSVTTRVAGGRNGAEGRLYAYAR
ncbi:MAG: hypothetical protein WC558_07350 [Patulibacter sp.]